MVGGERIKVLLIEDDPDSRELLAELLATDFDVDTAPDGASGLEAFQRDHPHVVVTDEALPGIPGTAVARQVKDLNPETGVILVSGYLKPPRTEYCDLVLRKPVDLQQLSDAVIRLHSRYRH